ncbi:MAG: guanylate kinase [Gemmatimonadetes bacterium]|nr:guanylate kinase [Gemmatimonadota bacterium]
MTEALRPLVLVAPSGTGKTTVARALVERHPERFAFSVSATTRPPRSGEVDGIHYRFLDEAGFKALIDGGELAEWAVVHGRLYGTPLASLDSRRLEGRTPVLDIDIQGARQVVERIPGSVAIFLLPPGPDAWITRLVGRGTETPVEVRTRLETAMDELERAREFEEFVVNDRLMETVESVVAVFSGTPSAGVSKLRAEGLCSELKRGARDWIRQTSPDPGTPDSTEM